MPLLNVSAFFLISQEVFELLQYIHSCKSLHERNLLKETAHESHSKQQVMKLPTAKGFFGGNTRHQSWKSLQGENGYPAALGDWTKSHSMILVGHFQHGIFHGNFLFQAWELKAGGLQWPGSASLYQWEKFWLKVRRMIVHPWLLVHPGDLWMLCPSVSVRGLCLSQHWATSRQFLELLRSVLYFLEDVK